VPSRVRLCFQEPAAGQVLSNGCQKGGLQQHSDQVSIMATNFHFLQTTVMTVLLCDGETGAYT